MSETHSSYSSTEANLRRPQTKEVKARVSYEFVHLQIPPLPHSSG
jgi:hypothetical protein